MSNSSNPVRIPITNVYGGGDYTGAIQVGSNQDVVNVILDTGSSTLAVKPTDYKADQDKDLEATALAQDVLYGTGGWTGPVVHTTVGFEHTGGKIALSKTPIAICDDEQQGNFGNAGGIMGLAYSTLNSAYDVTSVLQKNNINPPVTFPWPFNIADNHQAVEDFNTYLQTHGQESDQTPYFQLLEENGVVANKLAFYTLRSCVNITSASETFDDGLNDPLNQGYLILGGGESETDLYEGTFQEVQVQDDVYYNVKLISVQVGDQPAVKAEALQSEYVPTSATNCIVDSGTNHLALAYDVYQDIIKAMGNINQQFVYQIHMSSAQEDGIPMSDLDLSQWPDITFNLEGPAGEAVALSCAPATYWQENFPSPGNAHFNVYSNPRMIGPGQEYPIQSILGLTLMNNYYTIFDRSVGSKGVIKFAKIKAPAQ